MSCRSSSSQEGAKNVYTTIDLDLQRAAADAIRCGMREVDRQLGPKPAKSGTHAEAALIAIDPHTGEIKAMVGRPRLQPEPVRPAALEATSGIGIQALCLCGGAEYRPGRRKSDLHAGEHR